jgi:3-oxoacyl-[acyl-carrier protein] reductase
MNPRQSWKPPRSDNRHPITAHVIPKLFTGCLEVVGNRAAGHSRCMGGTIVITGGEGGLARAVADVFRAAGRDVRLPGRQELDVTDREAVTAYFAGLETDLLVCAAGITRDAPLAKLEESAWDETLAVNLHAAARCARGVLKGMWRRKSGHIVFVSSFSALHPPAGQAAYAAAKAGLIGLAKSLAREAGPANVRVNVILPGFLETPMTAKVSPGRRDEVRKDHVLGRFNTPDAVARFLRALHEDLPHTSGQVFQLDSRVA